LAAPDPATIPEVAPGTAFPNPAVRSPLNRPAGTGAPQTSGRLAVVVIAAIVIAAIVLFLITKH
jgi:hypothetical protein